MDMSQKEEVKANSSMDEILAELLKSVSAEEFALANLMNATAETLQALATIIANAEVNNQKKQVNFLCKSINKTLETVIMKEWILAKKLDNIFEIIDDYGKRKRKRRSDKA